jgi:hypothetical protein
VLEVDVNLNCVVRGHLIEDANVRVQYEEFPAESDVGILRPYVEVFDVTSIKDRPIRRILGHLSSSDWSSLIEKVSQKHFG